MHQERYTLGHVHIKVRELERAVAFYTEFLNFRVTECVGRYVFMTFGDRHHELAVHEVAENAAPPDPNGVGLYHFAIELPDLRALKALHKRLVAAGVTTKPVDHGISKVLYFADPDGNGLEAYVDTRASNNRFEWRGESTPLNVDAIPE